MEKIYKSGKTEFSKEKREKMKRTIGKASHKTKTGYFAVFAVLTLAISILNSAFINAAYQPPLYIANPETGECQYYFSGESDCFDACMEDCQGAGLNYTNCMEPCANKYCHYNLKPEGFTADIGKTADFESVNESCEAWQDCIGKNGEWNSTSSKCVAKIEQSGQEKSGISGLNVIILIISIIILAAVIMLYIQTRKIQREIQAGHKEHKPEHGKEGIK